MIDKLRMGMDCGIYDNSRAITELVKAGWSASVTAGEDGAVLFAMIPPGPGEPGLTRVGEGQTLNVAIRRCLEQVKGDLCNG